MDTAEAHGRARTVLTLCGRTGVVTVLVVAAVNWLGWATDVDRLTRIYSSWAPMPPWSSLLLAAVALAILLQSDPPGRVRVWLGRLLAVAVAVVALAYIIERASGRSMGADLPWLGDLLRGERLSLPGRPHPRSAVSILLLATGVGLLRVEGRWVRVAWPLFLFGALATPFVTIIGHMFKVVSEVNLTSSTGQGPSTALCVVLLVAAALVTRSDRSPVAWLMARPDRWSLLRLGIVVSGLPLLVGLWRLPFLALNMGTDAAWILSTAMATLAVGVVAFYLSQREQGLLIERERLSGQRAEAEARYRILADNAVDIVVHVRGNRVAWISPSVETALGYPPYRLIGTDLADRIHPDDLELVLGAVDRMSTEKPALERFRVRAANGRYHWVEAHGKPYVDAQGCTDGLITAMRIVDDKVEAERRLEQLARYDTLTGLVNRAETIARFNTVLEGERSPDSQLGVLFCDIDHFKTINDTWGHLTGDVVLSTIGARIRVCVREGDTVGRLGGDEILVLLNGVHDLDEVVEIAEKIRLRASEPVHFADQTIRATLSIGATLATPGESVYTMMARADVAMYAAKRAGRDTVTRI